LRSERAHFEKHSAGIIPKSGNMADRVVKEGITHVLTKMGIMGIRLKIAIKGAIPPEFELVTNFKNNSSDEGPKMVDGKFEEQDLGSDPIPPESDKQVEMVEVKEEVNK
jgi:small subunit ribosomal protein S3